MKFYRVFPHVPGAKLGEPGHPLYVPDTQGGGRVDNPGLYRVFYASDAPEGAVAERFGNLATWMDAMLAPPPGFPEAALSLAEYDAPPGLRVLDLDDPAELVRRGLRPSRVISRDRRVTQPWAARVHAERKWSGIRWWSFWDSRWGSVGLFRQARLGVRSVVTLDREHPAVIAAAEALARPWR